MLENFNFLVGTFLKEKKKQVKCILIIYFYLTQLSKILSMCNNYRNTSVIFYFLVIMLGPQNFTCVLCSTSQFSLATFHVPNSHLWLAATPGVWEERNKSSDSCTYNQVNQYIAFNSYRVLTIYGTCQQVLGDQCKM